MAGRAIGVGPPSVAYSADRQRGECSKTASSSTADAENGCHRFLKVGVTTTTVSDDYYGLKHTFGPNPTSIFGLFKARSRPETGGRSAVLCSECRQL